MINRTEPQSELREFVERAIGLHETLAKCHPSLQRGQVWCRTCGHTERVDSADCLRHGWPKCCGYTMTIDPPETPERKVHDQQ